MVGPEASNDIVKSNVDQDKLKLAGLLTTLQNSVNIL